MSDRADPADGPRPHQHLQPERSPTDPTTIAPGPEFGVSASTFAEHTEVQVRQGQFPPPDAVEKYEAVLPGAFDGIVAMAERLQEARIAEARYTQEHRRDDILRGHWLGFAATALAIAGAISFTVVGALTGTDGPYWVAVALIGVPVMAVAKALVDSARRSAGREAMHADRQALEPPIADRLYRMPPKG